MGYGHYHEEYERQPGGRWLIKKLTVTRLRVDELGPDPTGGKPAQKAW